MPLLTSRNYLIGVIEIINKKDDTGKTVPFTENDLLYVKHFSHIAAGAIERASMTREIILRMIKMTELRAPKETGPHVNKVGAYSVSIYREWAKKKDIPAKKAEKYTDTLKIAAMLHNLGKVGISDTILKKPARLTEEERRAIMYHPVIGAQLFENKTSDMDMMSAQIALNHHEKWNGEGYPGKIDNIYSDNVKLGKGKKSQDIPLAGRIVAIADVYDALVSKRTYKDGWTEEKVLKLIKEEAGQHFDPELVDYFLNVQESVKAIKKN
ncbi:MAG: HD domain-containing protein [Elusimicrobiota bacterium]|nr:HD domain-containing protein [Elusimicrobiota bacterium]